MKLGRHLRLVAQAVTEAQGLLIPTLGLIEVVLGMAHSSQLVVNQQGSFLVTVLFYHIPRPVIPAFGFFVLELQLGNHAQGPIILDHFLFIGKALVNIKGLTVQLLGLGIETLVLTHLTKSEIVVGHRRPVFTALDDVE